MGKPFSKRAKLRHLQEGSERYLRKASVGARMAAVARGQKAILKWHKKVGTDLNRLNNVLEKNKESFIKGNFKVPKGMRWRDINKFTGDTGNKTTLSRAVPTAVILGGISGSVAGGIVGLVRTLSNINHAISGEVKIGAGVGAGLMGVIGVGALAENYYKSQRSEFLRLRKMLEKERLIRAKKGEVISNELIEHNKKVIKRVLDQISIMMEANEKQQRKVEALVEG